MPNAQPPPGAGVNNTSVNIATAFREATRGHGTVVHGQRREREESHHEDQDGEDGDGDDGGKETHLPQPHQGEGASKKRKKRKSADLSFKPSKGDDSGDSSSSDQGGPSSTKAKRPKLAVPTSSDGITIDDGTPSPVLVRVGLSQAPPPSTTTQSSKKSSARRKSGADTAYRPTAGESDDLSDSDESDGAKRRRRKGKARESTSTSGAIPIGRRDGEVWDGKKRKGGRKSGGRKSVPPTSTAAGEGEGEDMGGHDDFQGHQDDDHPPPGATFFLRPKSPSLSPNAPQHESPPHQHQPFNFSLKSLQQPPPPPALDPAFDAFDRSQNNSIDDSGVRGSSYDYSEEERIVAQLEFEKRQQQQQQVPLFPVAGPSGSGSGNGIRKRGRLPPPPSREPYLGDIAEEEDERHRPRSVGRTIGIALRPVWNGVRWAWRALQDPLLDWRKIAQAVVLAVALIAIFFLSSSLRRRPEPPQQPTYSAPSVPADSLSSLITRLTSLESALSTLSSTSTSERSLAHSSRTSLSSLSSQVTTLTTSLDSLKSSLASSTKDHSSLSLSVRSIQTTLDSLSTRLSSLSSSQESSADDISSLRSTVSNVESSLSTLHSHLARVERDLVTNAEQDRLTQIALAAIEKRLPSRMAVQLDPASGKLEIDPVFWKQLKDAFVDKSDLAALRQSQPAGKDTSSSSGGKDSWNDFLRNNEKAMKSWVDSDLSHRVATDAIVSRRSFLDTLHRELKLLKVDFETKSNENVQKIGIELMDKVAKQDAMRRAKEPVPVVGGGAGQITLKTPDGQNVSAIITSLVDSLLLRHSKDVLARPDYALYTSGGRVIPSLTSPTYSASPVGLTPRLLSLLSSTKPTPGRPPVTALHPDNSLGSCWPFAGARGQLGILLSRRVVPTSITLEHASIDIALDHDVSSAPKDFEVWGVVEDADSIERLATYRSEAAAARQAGQEVELDEEEMSSLPPTPNHLLLVSGQYDVTSENPVQSFPVSKAARDLEIPVGVVVVRFLSNHGEQAYTCVYRVRVTGRSEAVVAAEAANAPPPSSAA
ncbi:hypothetical protein RQP46_008737 [Phenoliferia psychrophenolica]